ncbi:NAD(P)/FAD-dependent oxidoreductase [Desulfogranum marinum]|uniref:NAD(P)/FAD-dependent oxidoreductase n=1 Tax=Desulfogranum marinum TaxID=453220 RepID=UPI00196233AD|nr:FAD-dependent oxidoreductase [Desulfogranum marinum]MBM9512551.1 FAD-dependent oxidoreductase [Desulfogranum marinum]
MAKRRLVLIGGGHAHMVTLANIRTIVDKGYDVTVIQPSTHHYYSGMGPGMLGGTYHPDDIRFATRKVVESQGGTFVKDKVVSIDPEKQVVRLDNSDEEVGYDVLSCNAGSSVPRDIIHADSPEIFTAKPIESLFRAQEKILSLSKERALNIAIIGGGPSSIEIAGNVQQLGQRQALHQPHISIYTGREIMVGKPAKIRKLALASLTKRGVKVLEGNYVKNIDQGIIHLEDGTSHPADIIFPAVGVRPSPIFADSGLATGPDGGLLVNRFLQCPAYPNIFGGGDCIYFEPDPLDKVGVYAVRQNPVLYHNLMAGLEGEDLEAFQPGGSYLLIYNLGNDEGVFCKWSVIFGGKLAFKIKDYIDRKFIEKFQTIEK